MDLADFVAGFPRPDAAGRAALAPLGRLRAGINLSNFLLVSGRTPSGAPTGVSPSLAAALAHVLDVPCDLVEFPHPSDVTAAGAAGRWDIANIGADPAREEHIAFSPPYCEIESTYLVRQTGPVATIDDVDSPGVRIATKAGAAYTLWLERNLAHAELMPAETLDESLGRFIEEDLEVLAGLRPRLNEDVSHVPGGRVLPGRFTAVQQAIGTPRDRDPAGIAYLRRFVTAAVEQGLVSRLIEHFGVRDLSVPQLRD